MANILEIVNCQGARVGEYQLPEQALELEKGEQAVHDAVVAFLSGIRANTACTKTRGEVRGGGAKPFRQKGTGRARAGSSRSPIWTGGGVTFGPTPERNYTKKINKKVFKLALKRAFSERVVEGDVIIVDEFQLTDHKTRSAAKIFEALKVDSTALLAMPGYEEAVICATGNLPGVVLRLSAGINVYELLRFNKLVFTKAGLDAFIERLV